MDRRRQAQEQQHPLPLWLRWSLAIFVPLVVVGGVILWIIQGNGAIIPIAVFTALGTLLAFSQVLPLLFPRAHRREETMASASSLLPPMDQETPLHTAFEAAAFQPSQSPFLASHDDASQKMQEEHPVASSRLSKVVSLWKVPTPLTPLIGREQDVVRIAALLKQPAMRCLTLIGPGGIGKTRLALQIATQLRDYFADGICFVALAAITDPELVIPAIAQELGIQEMVGLTLVEQVTLSLRDRNFLLILDNFEQVAGAASKVEEQLRACPSLKVLMTSRAVLHVQGEQEFPISPLALPPRSQLPEHEDLMQYEAVVLFVRRTQAILPDFHITQANARTVAEICICLDGLPLAIELAAARMRMWSPQTLLSQLTQRFEVLTSNALSVPERQQTLRNTLNWSYHLLDAQEQRLFRSLSVFVGGCTLEAVEAMGKASQTTELKVLPALDGVTSLLEKSLLQVEQEGEEVRFIMLETIREFGLVGLRENREVEICQQAHALYYLAVAEEAELHFKGAQQALWLHQLEREQENLRAALEWLIDQKATESAFRLSGALWRFWDIRGYWSEGRRWLEAVLGLSQIGERSAARAKALYGAGSLDLRTGSTAVARALFEESMALYRELGDKQGLAESGVGLARSRYSSNEDTATRTLLEESVTLARQVGGWTLAYTLQNLADFIETRGDSTRAYLLLEESMALYRELGDTHRLSRALNEMGRMELFQGNVTQATARGQESLTLARTLGNRLDIARALLRLAQTKSAQGDETQAVALLEESLALARELGTKLHIAEVLLTLGSLVLYQGDLARAATCAQESLTLFREVGDSRGNIDVALCLLGEVKRSQGDFSQAKALHLEGLSLARGGAGHPYGIGWNLIGLAKIDAVEGHARRAVLLFGAAESWCDPSVDMDPIERMDYERTVEGARAQLGEETFTAVWVQGRSLTPEQVLVSLEHASTAESE
jgi:predicted ATPase